MDTNNILNILDSILLVGEFMILKTDEEKKAYNKVKKLRNKLTKKVRGKGHEYIRIFPE